jgi:hypothetical protein
MLLTYFLNDFEIVPVAHIITGIAFVFTFHMRCISIVRSGSCDYYYYYYYFTIWVSPVTGISSQYFSWTSSDPNRSRFKFHTAVLSVLSVMFLLLLLLLFSSPTSSTSA